MCKLKFIVPGVICMALSQVSFAQTLPVCASQAADPDGDGFGFADGASCIVTSESAGPPEFTNQETGAPVNIVRANWDGLVDFNNPITCTRFVFTTTNSYNPTRDQSFTFGPLTTSAPFEGSVVIANGRTLNWSIDNGIYSGPSNLGMSPWVEIVNVGEQLAVRTWFSDTLFNQCAATDPNISFSPTGVPFGGNTEPQVDDNPEPQVDANPEPQACVDTDPVGDGWGWDGTTSCRVAVTEQPGMAQPGMAQPASTTCEDTAPVGDGWGWDGTASCRVTGSAQPVTTTCEDTAPVGDGWGWDGTSSCRVSGSSQPVAATCEDTAPVGDGWGWDGTTSCRVAGPQPVTSACVDTVPLGDGWGWDGTSSCRVSGGAQAVATTCVDTAPVGDGWGWDGQNSCRI